MKNIGIIATLFLLAGCLGPEVEELEFFEVRLLSVQPGASLGTVALQAEVEGLSSMPDDYGFVWSADLEALSMLVEVNWEPLDLPLESAVFQHQITGLDLDRTFFFRAYLERGERRVFSEIQPFSFNVSLGINPEYQLSNDTITVEGFVVGLQALEVNVAQHGHVYSSMNELPIIEQDNATALDLIAEDGSFTSVLPELDFNTDYFVRSYLMDEDGAVYYSDAIEARVNDGWRELPTLAPMALQDAAATVINGNAYIGFGLFEEEETRQLWRYNPQSGEWFELPQLLDGLPRSNGVAFTISNELYIGLGKRGNNALGDFWKISPEGAQDWEAVMDVPPSMGTRQGAVAFVLNGKAYIGAGENTAGELLNDFWEFDPDQPENRWRPVARLPLKQSDNHPVQYDQGRVEAVAFTSGSSGRAYVGAGFSTPVTWNDFWEFIPPATTAPSDTGQWVFHSWFPGQGRSRTAFFTLEDKGYMGTGFDPFSAFFLSGFWEFNPSAEDGAYWQPVMEFLGGNTAGAVGFAIDGKGYLGLGERKIIDDQGFENVPVDMIWEYTPKR